MRLVEIDEKITKLAKNTEERKLLSQKSLLTLRQNQCVFQSNIPDDDLKCTRKSDYILELNVMTKNYEVCL